MPHLRDAAGLGRQRTDTLDADWSGADACGEPNLSGRIPATSRAWAVDCAPEPGDEAVDGGVVGAAGLRPFARLGCRGGGDDESCPARLYDSLPVRHRRENVRSHIPSC